jgi:hypothetical protein
MARLWGWVGMEPVDETYYYYYKVGVTLTSIRGLIWQTWFRFVHYLKAGEEEIYYDSDDTEEAVRDD